VVVVPASKQPKSVEIRSYQVGFGDCFLLTFKYAASDRHVLIDFGSMALPEGAGPGYMLKVAKQIAADCGNQLDIVVATHRHSDHISGFATNKKRTGSGDVIAACKPKMVIQPWTENPDAPEGATEAQITAVRAFTGRLDQMHAVADSAARTATMLRRGADDGVVKQLKYLGSDNIKNRSAVENLMRMGKNYYVKCGEKLPVARLLPGVKLHVLGPPSLEQTDAISRQRSTDDQEFWQLQATAGARVGTDSHVLFPDVASKSTPPYARWFRYHVRNLRADNMLSIVRILDRQMNNTSVILLFEIGHKLLLFPGDAQIENWRYALDQEKFRKLLRRVSLYKVGHHGSRNATPRTLWDAFVGKGKSDKPGRLKSLLSTLAGVHGDIDNKSEVPRETLVAALRNNTEFHTTEAYQESEIRRIVTL
jgi:hypothetical protein